MITEEELDTLADFGKEKDGTYSDRWQFGIIKGRYKDDKNWHLCFISEVDDSGWFIKALKDFDDLKNVYKAITNEDLKIKTNGKII